MALSAQQESAFAEASSRGLLSETQEAAWQTYSKRKNDALDLPPNASEGEFDEAPERGTLLDPLLQGATANFSDEAIGGLASTFANFVNMLTPKSGITGKGYEGINAGEGTRLARADLEQFSERNPGTSIAANVAGAVATSGPFAARALASPAIKKLGAAGLPVVAGGEGFVHGVGAGEEGERLKEGLIQGGQSAVAGPLMNYTGGKILDRLTRKNMKRVRPDGTEIKGNTEASDLIEHELEMTSLGKMARDGDVDESMVSALSRIVKNPEKADIVGNKTVDKLKEIIRPTHSRSIKRTARKIAKIDPGEATARSGLPLMASVISGFAMQDAKVGMMVAAVGLSPIIVGKMSKAIANHMTKKETDDLLAFLKGDKAGRASRHLERMMNKYGSKIAAGSAGVSAGVSMREIDLFKKSLSKGYQEQEETGLADMMVSP